MRRHILVKKYILRQEFGYAAVVSVFLALTRFWCKVLSTSRVEIFEKVWTQFHRGLCPIALKITLITSPANVCNKLHRHRIIEIYTMHSCMTWKLEGLKQSATS